MKKIVEDVGPTKYFTKEEQEETLRKKEKFDFSLIAPSSENAAKRKRPMYTYSCSGAIYEGEWIGGLRHGCGTMTWPDTAQYHCEWAFNQASREGKFTYPNGDMYEGGWATNMMCGYGVFRHDNGTVFRGNWY